MELRHLRYAICLSEELHFGRAAKRLNISQPPLTRQIRMIERELGVELFERNRAGVRLTPAGERFVEEARRVIDQFDHTTQAAVRASRGEVGHLVVGTVPTQKTLLTKCVRVFSERFPGVQLQFQCMCTEGQLDALYKGTIDLGFLVLPVQASSLIIQPVSREPMLVGLPKDHPLAHCTKVPLQALATEPMIMLPRSHCIGFYDQMVRSCADAGVRLRVAHEVTSILTGLALVEARLGLCVFPASINEYATEQIALRELTPPLPPVEHALAYREANDSGVLSRFISVAHSVLLSERVPPPMSRADGADRFRKTSVPR